MLNRHGKLNNQELRIENTNLCNAHCSICPREKLSRPLATMCYGVFTTLVDQGISLGIRNVSVFGYGEPLIDVNIGDKILYCTSLGLKTHITTNASLLTRDKCYEMMDVGLKNIRFSFHAISPLSYERVHRRLDWLKVWSNFAQFLDINDSRGHPCAVHITNIPLHGESIESIRSTWERYCDYLEIWKPHNWGGGRAYRKLKRRKKTCGRPFNGPVQIQADGDVIPCCFLTNSELILGNIHDDRLIDILNGDKYKELQHAHKTGILDGLPCDSCDQLNLEEENPLLYSNRDPDRIIGKTSTCKISVN